MQLSVVELSETNAGKNGLQDKAKKAVKSSVNTIALRSINTDTYDNPPYNNAGSAPGAEASWPTI